jgi:hypothetical protein
MREVMMSYLKQNYDDQDHFRCERVVEFRNRLGHRTCWPEKPKPATLSFGWNSFRLYDGLSAAAASGKTKCRKIGALVTLLLRKTARGQLRLMRRMMQRR